MGSSVPSGSGRNRRALAEINVTPLVDVMLVLLIISMVASPMLEKGINLELPQTVSATSIEEARIVVSIDRDGRIRLNERPLHEALLEDRMRGVALNNPNESVYVRADKLLPYGEVIRVMDTIRTAGVQRVSLVTVPVDILPTGDSGS